MKKRVYEFKCDTVSFKHLIFLFLLVFSITAFADSYESTEYVPEAQLVGEARMTYLFWKVYDARLYAPEGKWQPTQPFALELKYLRKLKVDGWLSYLPGVRWASSKKEALVLDKRIARFFAKSFFHLLGYRAREMDKTQLLLNG